MRSKLGEILKDLKFDRNGLLPAIIQDYKTAQVLMLAYMNKESLKRTLRTGKTCFWSRSRKEYWVKGQTSGHFQYVKSIFYDCDMDALLIKVRQVGVACHTGNRSCFYRKIR
ncbi:MAG: phosphoribosyl-AMP cyclohydrolase [Candidatus Omnitrophica bacterium]|nr:phosphoribosyl-AMP cyclohydrolase [Candidatus Omnitrophota bacterium]